MGGNIDREIGHRAPAFLGLDRSCRHTSRDNRCITKHMHKIQVNSDVVLVGERLIL